MPAKQIFIATIFAGIVSVLALIFFVIKPQIDQLSRLHQLTQERRIEYNDLLVEENSYRTARKDFAKIKDTAEIIAGLFPVKEKLVGNIERLEAAAEAFGEEFSLSITDPSQEDRQTRTKKGAEPVYTIVPKLINIEVIPYDFTVAGSFSGVIRFLQTLEHQPFYSELETLELTSKFLGGQAPGEKPARTGAVEGHMRAAFYAKKEAGQP